MIEAATGPEESQATWVAPLSLLVCNPDGKKELLTWEVAPAPEGSQLTLMLYPDADVMRTPGEARKTQALCDLQARGVDEFEGATPAEVDEAIDAGLERLKAAGISVQDMGEQVIAETRGRDGKGGKSLREASAAVGRRIRRDVLEQDIT
jgi:hypothetical protein